ncbi:hypothetical protein VTO42DRAFT_7917 [Malbranchea cinnamomea]
MSTNRALRSVPNMSEYFKQNPNQNDAWEALWQGQITPWDRGVHNPALEDTLLDKTGLLGRALVDCETEDGAVATRRKKALVPGCGRGVDVFLLAEFGYDAYGLECSPTAVEACRAQADRVREHIRARDPAVGLGSYTFLLGDFFRDDWLKEAGLHEGSFDLIYDYTFFCALNPSLRPQWALRHSQLLAPSPVGNLICLEFPTVKEPPTLGPPFASPPAAYLEHLSHPGEDVPYDENGYIKSDPLREPSPNGLERVAHWQPQRTHAVGKSDDGTVQDWVSIWRRRN